MGICHCFSRWVNNGITLDIFRLGWNTS